MPFLERMAISSIPHAKIRLVVPPEIQFAHQKYAKIINTNLNITMSTFFKMAHVKCTFPISTNFFTSSCCCRALNASWDGISTKRNCGYCDLLKKYKSRTYQFGFKIFSEKIFFISRNQFLKYIVLNVYVEVFFEIGKLTRFVIDKNMLTMKLFFNTKEIQRFTKQLQKLSFFLNWKLRWNTALIWKTLNR